jgi:hypothetical protein
VTVAGAGATGESAGSPERTSSQVWRLGIRVLAVQVVTLLALWLIQTAFAGA